MGKKGFTLIEILIVLAVLAILIGIAVPRIKGMQDQANITKAKSEMKTYQIAIEAYRVNTGSYPSESSSVGASYLASATPLITTSLRDALSSSGAEYNYKVDGNYYAIFSAGVDGSLESGNDIDSDGVVTLDGDDLCITNGSGC